MTAPAFCPAMPANARLPRLPISAIWSANREQRPSPRSAPARSGTPRTARCFLRQVRERTGLAVRIIDGSEEARLTLLGVSRALDARTLQPRTLVIDIGGGSTEIISIEPAFETSLPLGAVYLTERFLRHDPPLPGTNWSAPPGDQVDSARRRCRRRSACRQGSWGPRERSRPWLPWISNSRTTTRPG